MEVMARLRSAKYTAWLLLSIFVVPYISCGAAAAQRSDATVQTVVLFPLDDLTGNTNSRIAAELDAFLRESLAAYHGYKVVVYSDRLPAVQRLVAMQPDKTSATEGPFSTDSVAISRASMLGQAMSADLVIVGSVKEYAFAAQEGTAKIAAEVEVLQGDTGRSIMTAKVTGQAVKPADAEGVSEARLASEAVRDAGGKIFREITGEEYTEPAKPKIAGAKEKKRKSWVPMLLLSLGLGLLLGGSGGSTSSSGGSSASGLDNPPNPPSDLD